MASIDLAKWLARFYTCGWFAPVITRTRTCVYFHDTLTFCSSCTWSGWLDWLSGMEWMSLTLLWLLELHLIRFMELAIVFLCIWFTNLRKSSNRREQIGSNFNVVKKVRGIMQMQEDQEDHAGIISVRRLCSSYVTIWLRGALWGNVKIDGALF